MKSKLEKFLGNKAEIPLISIITVNFNNLEGLKETMDSVFEQTWQDFEFIVIDGRSADGSIEYIESQIDKIDHWVSEPDTGIYNAMNKGIKMASGEYLLFLNSGDYLSSPKVFSELNSYLSGIDFVYFDVRVLDGEKTYIKPSPENLDFSFFKKDSLPHQGILIKATCFDRLGYYDENYRIISDWKFIALGVLKYNLSYRKVPVEIAVFTKDGISSKERDLLFAERNEILDREFWTFSQFEDFKKKVYKSKSIKYVRKLGFLKWLNER